MSRRIVYGAKEYIKVDVTGDVQLDNQPVAFSFDGVTWITAEWLGSAGLSRSARILLDTTTLEPRSEYGVYVRITDDPEIPIIDAGDLHVT